MERFIKLYPTIVKSKIWTNPAAFKIWVWCLFKASHKKEFVPFNRGKGRGNITVELLPRQFVFGRSMAAAELNLNGETIRFWMRKFASDEYNNLIGIEGRKSYSIITISKYVNYSGSGSSPLPCENQVRLAHNPTESQKVSNENSRICTPQYQVRLTPNPYDNQDDGSGVEDTPLTGEYQVRLTPNPYDNQDVNNNENTSHYHKLEEELVGDNSSISVEVENLEDKEPLTEVQKSQEIGELFGSDEWVDRYKRKYND